jgi:glycosyltransferase involved in cell wall biosynthesis
VSVIARPPYKQRIKGLGKPAEAVRIWRALWRARSKTIVYRTAGAELASIAIYGRVLRRRVIFSTSNIVDFEPARLMLFRRHDLMMYRLGVRLAHEIVVQTEEQQRLCQAAFNRSAVVIKSIKALGPPQQVAPEAFLWVGRLVAYKRPLDYIALARGLPEAKFWMVGVPAPHRDADRLVIEAVQAQSREVPNLELLPPCDHDEIENLMGRAVASVNTSELEGMPNVLLEGWSRGVPALVMTHDPGGVVQEYGLGGFANGSWQRFLDLARDQWDTRHERGALSSRCRMYVRKHHSPDFVVARWVQVLAGDQPI